MFCCKCFKTNKVYQAKRNSIYSPNKRKNKIEMKEENGTETTFKLKDRFRCIFCGGKNCKHEEWTNHKSPSLVGLHSDLIDNCIYASQRPSTNLINKYNLIEEFKKNKISLIVNVQREGEHPYCGPNEGLEESGYTYNPEVFEKEGIRVIHSGWKDMSVPDSVSFILKIVKEIYKTIEIKKNKVLVHCHAGYGRTGIIIACFLIYNYQLSAEAAVKMLRSYRSKCIEKRQQFDFCNMFEKYLSKCRTVFTSYQENLQMIMKYQKEIFSDENENSIKRTVPQMIYKTIDLIIDVINKEKENSQVNEYDELNNMKMKILSSINGTEEVLFENEKNILNLKIDINQGNWREYDQCKCLIIYSEMLFDWIDDCALNLISQEKMRMIGDVIKNYVKSLDNTQLMNIDLNEDKLNQNSQLNIGHIGVTTNDNTNSKYSVLILNKLLKEMNSILDPSEFEIIIQFSYFLSFIKSFDKEILNENSNNLIIVEDKNIIKTILKKQSILSI